MDGEVTHRAVAPHRTWGDGCDAWLLVDRPSLNVMQERMPPETSERLHRHVRVEQVYFVLEGEAVVQVDDREERLQAGQALTIAAGRPHRIKNESTDGLEFLVISTSAPGLDRIEL